MGNEINNLNESYSTKNSFCISVANLKEYESLMEKAQAEISALKSTMDKLRNFHLEFSFECRDEGVTF